MHIERRPYNSIMSANKATAPDAPVKLNLSSEPETVILPPSNLAYLEKNGPFLKTAPLPWKEFWSIATGQLDDSEIAGAVVLAELRLTNRHTSHARRGEFVFRAVVFLGYGNLYGRTVGPRTGGAVYTMIECAHPSSQRPDPIVQMGCRMPS